MLVTIIGAHPYNPKTDHNREQYLKIITNMKFLPKDGLAADTDSLEVDPTFVSYAIRHKFMRPLSKTVTEGYNAHPWMT